MELNPFIAEEACARLRNDRPPAQLRRILNLLELDLIEPGPEPDYDDLASRYSLEVPENEYRGSVTFTGELSLFGQTKTLHFRYSLVGEFGEYPDDFVGFGMLGSVGQLDVLTWSSIDGRTAEWTKIDFGLLSRPMIDALDDLVLQKVANSNRT